MLPASDSTSSEVKQLSNMPVGTQEGHKKDQDSLSESIFEPGTSQIHSKVISIQRRSSICAFRMKYESIISLNLPSRFGRNFVLVVGVKCRERILILICIGWITNRTLYYGARGSAVGWGTALPSRKVAGSIPHDVIGIFHWHNSSGRTMTLGSTQPLTEMSNRNFLGGRAAGA